MNNIKEKLALVKELILKRQAMLEKINREAGETSACLVRSMHFVETHNYAEADGELDKLLFILTKET